MNRQELLSNIWVRMLVFLWVIIFPLVYVAIPALKMATGDAPVSWTPLWAFMLWVLGPLVASIGLKYWGSHR